MRLLASILLMSAVLACGSVEAQTPLTTDPGSAVRTRDDLERLLKEYQQALASPAYSESVKRGIRADAQLITDRLQNGDFRVGDRITLYVEGETDLPDTVQVEPGPKISLPRFGDIPLDGVLRSEITDRLTEALGKFIRMPVVRATPLMRLSVQGAVARPGFYTMPASMLVGEALMVAGGPSPAANIDDIQIDRGPQHLLEGEALQEAMRNGLTLDQLNLQAGDQIVVPAQSTGSTFRNVISVVGAVGSLSALLIYFLFRR
jgi:polysaccharide biosynthesis/export protein